MPHLKQWSTAGACILFVATWWGFFLLPEITNPLPLVDESVARAPPTQLVHDFLPPITKQELIDALTGNTEKMVQLLSDWESDAQLLELVGKKATFPSSASLITTLARETPTQKQLFPQTFSAAGILLSLLPPKHITALPAGLRLQKQLYPEALTARVPQDASFTKTEAATGIGRAVAFVSPLSHPPTLAALRKRGVQLVDLGNITTIQQLKQATLLCGKWAETPRRAELLNLFVEAAMHAMENRLELEKIENSVYLEYRQTLTVPTRRTFAGALIRRLGLSKQWSAFAKQGFSYPIEFEEVAKANPKTLIFAISDEKQKKEILGKPAIAQLIENGSRAYFVPRGTYETSSQFFLLGYFDLCTILASS